MKFKRIVVRETNLVINTGVRHKAIYQRESFSIGTFDENKANTCENELWISDLEGKEPELKIIDVRLVGIYKEVMKFRGYLLYDYGRTKRGTKVDVNVFN